MGDAVGVVSVGHCDFCRAALSAAAHASHRELRVDGVPVIPARRQDGGDMNGGAGVPHHRAREREPDCAFSHLSS
jgi:hypothetical protein